ncbi:MAG: substrate-binding domain-containing protein [Cyanobacteria bacterium P01_F01_bin.86]
MNNIPLGRFFLLGTAFLVLSSCESWQLGASRLEDSQAKLKVGGSSEVYEVIEILSEGYELANSDREVTIEFFPPSQSSGGIEGVKDAVFDMGGVSREPTEAEINSQLTYLPLVETPLVLVIHESVTGITNINADQIKAIYKGDITNWQELGGPDADIVLFDFTEDENEKKVLRDTYLGANLAITPDAIVFPEDDELLATAAITEFSLATVPLEDDLAALPMTVLSIDGVAPSIANLQSGTYKMSLPLGVVIPQELPDITQSFVSFIQSSEGQQLLLESNYALANATE